MRKWRLILTVLAVLAVAIPQFVIPQVALAAPADAYWVGDGGDWTDAANHWAIASGGAPGAGNMPDATSNVHFDANSFTVGAQTVTVDAAANCLDMDWTGVTNTPTLSNAAFVISVYGDLTLVSGMTWTNNGSIYPRAPGAASITTGGQTMGYTVFPDAGGPWTLQDAYNSGANPIIHNNGTLDTNGKTVTTTEFRENAANVRTLTLGASTINISGAAGWNNSGTDLTLNEDTSTIILTGTAAFVGNGETYNDVELNGTAHTISGSNTFAALTFGPAAAQAVTFTDGTTQTVTTPSRSGAGTITFDGTGAAGWTITKAGGSTVEFANMDIAHSTATPASTWYTEPTTTDSGNNSGWIFTAAMTTSATTNTSTGQATINGNVTHAGTNNPTVTIYYGKTDGGTTPANWDANTSPTSPSQPQGVAAFTATLTNLDYDTTYYWTARAVNTGGTAWTSTASFTTSSYTGLRAMGGVVPILVLIGFLLGSGLMFNYGVRRYRDSDKGGGVLMLAIGLVFAAIGILMFPIVIDALSGVIG